MCTLCCCKYQLFKDRKQITTNLRVIRNASLLLQISVIQRSKANHNLYGQIWFDPIVVANFSYSKIESKSQPFMGGCCGYMRCCKYQLFKDRKQITTVPQNPMRYQLLLQISVIQRSKANHNGRHARIKSVEVVANISYSKIESKSQRFGE